MNQPDSRPRSASIQVLNGAKEDLNEEALRLMQGHRTGKLLLEVFFEEGQARNAKLHVNYGCKK